MGKELDRRAFLKGLGIAAGTVIVGGAGAVATGLIPNPFGGGRPAEAAGVNNDASPTPTPLDPEKLREMLIPINPTPRRAQEGIPQTQPFRILAPAAARGASVESPPVFDMAEWYKTTVEVASLHGKVSSVIEPGSEYQINFNPTTQAQAEQFAVDDQAKYGYDLLIVAGFASINKVPIGVTMEERGVADSNEKPISMGYFGRAEFVSNGRKIRAALYAPPLPQPEKTSRETLQSVLTTTPVNGFIGLDGAYANVIGGLFFQRMSDLSTEQQSRIRQIDDTFVALTRGTLR